MESLKGLVEGLSKEYSLPEWIVIGTPIFFFFLFTILIFLAIKILEPKYRLYKADKFYNIIWRWKWRKDEIIDLWCYCPECNAMLFVDDENCKTTTNLNEKITFFICRECGDREKGRIKGGDRRYSLSTVKRDIFGKVRNSSFDIYEYK